MRRLDLQDKETAEKVLELQAASYKIEAQIIGFYDIPPLKDTIDSLRKSGEIFYGYFEDEVLAGIISYKVIENTLDIHRVAVHPSFFRMGIAQKMVNFIEGAEVGINKVVVCTGKENKPAVNLYLKNGYKKTEDIEIGRNVYLTAFEKII
ncbi:GNAT family N-acetyltransferase [Lutispora sp.]|uniref:GNAT family N-acetyltransferase n=1 Tax=Lutispora sp. TaxID=2828727 RepID=UPI002B1FEF95|nr:GNAT family N-acetyltransferase [Lutispora sp.]MEA4960523.1 GNAT family N-acetyltransferase [Lutispora sp.]